MGKRGPLPKNKALQILHGTAPLSAEILEGANEEFIEPDRPGHFTKKEIEAWTKTIELLRPITALKKIDVAVLGAYCSAFVRWQTAEKELCKHESFQSGLCVLGEGGLKINPLVTISRDAQRDMVFYAAQLGMTPASRIKMICGAAKVIDRNPFVKLRSLKK